jgi:hypothetical protein
MKKRTLVQEASKNREAASGYGVGDPRNFGADPDPDPDPSTFFSMILYMIFFLKLSNRHIIFSLKNIIYY